MVRGVGREYFRGDDRPKKRACNARDGGGDGECCDAGRWEGESGASEKNGNCANRSCGIRQKEPCQKKEAQLAKGKCKTKRLIEGDPGEGEIAETASDA